MRVALLSDTHGSLDEALLLCCQECDEIWHAGDIGGLEIARRLEAVRPLRAVWGNIDGPELRSRYPEEQRFTVEGVRVLMTHITGHPGRWDCCLRRRLGEGCDLLIGGHSHILRIQRDPALSLLFVNPGACGEQGQHEQKTMLRFSLEEGKVKDMQIVQLGPRGGKIFTGKNSPRPQNQVPREQS